MIIAEKSSTQCRDSVIDPPSVRTKGKEGGVIQPGAGPSLKSQH